MILQVRDLQIDLKTPSNLKEALDLIRITD